MADEPNLITPTVGRIVWYFNPHQGVDTIPRSAIIAFVHNERMVNLCLFDYNGTPIPETSVALVQPGDEAPDHPHCVWMPYQVKKTFGSESGEKAAGKEVV